MMASPRATIECVTAFGMTDFTADVAQINLPTLVVHGTADKIVPIAATAPLLAMPIAFWLEGDRPGKRAILGGLVAVAGCIALARAR